MIFEANQDYYQLLEVDPTASLQEIKTAYLKIKSAYRKDNLALYGMLDSRECEQILTRIEEAYATLSEPDTRRDYDAEKRYEQPMRVDSIPSIDRVPPMASGDDTDLLNPPTTDFDDGSEGMEESSAFGERLTGGSGVGSAAFAAASAFSGARGNDSIEAGRAAAFAASLPALAATFGTVVSNGANGTAEISSVAARDERNATSNVTQPTVHAGGPMSGQNSSQISGQSLDGKVEEPPPSNINVATVHVTPSPSSAQAPSFPTGLDESFPPRGRTHSAPVFAPATTSPDASGIPIDEWTGPVLRKTREARRLSLDEVSSLTRISKTYLQAIEDETYDKLPAPVFVRGFLMQLAKTLKLPHEAVATNYMTRFRKKA